MATDKPSPRSPSISRRRFLQTTAAGAATVAVGADHAGLMPVQDADALGPVAVAGAVGAAAATDILIDEFTGGDAEEASDEATKEVLQTQFYQATKARKSANQSRILDQSNLVESVRHIAFEEGKTAAIEQINQGKTQSTVDQAAQDAANSYLATPQANAWKQWNEGVNELLGFVDTAQAEGISIDALIDASQYDRLDGSYDSICSISDIGDSVTLYNGNSLDVARLQLTGDGGVGCTETMDYNPKGFNDQTSGGAWGTSHGYIPVGVPDGSLTYLDQSAGWESVISQIDTIQTDVIDELTLWVDEVYGSVQSGELNPDQLFTSRQFANRAVEEGLPQAKADLMALNIPVDLDHEVTITTTFDDDSMDSWQISGLFAATTAPENGFSAGQSYTPNSTDQDGNTIVGSVYMMVDPNSAVATWDHYQTAVDGGIITFTKEPDDGIVYTIQTVDDEVATVSRNNFTKDSSTGDWEANVSGQLETPITEIGQLDSYPDTSENFQVEIDNQFTVTSIINTKTGETQSSATPQRPVKVQTGSNYTTAEEFKQASEQRQQDFEKLEELFKETQGGSLFGGFGSIGSDIKQYAVYAALGVGGVLGVNALTDILAE